MVTLAVPSVVLPATIPFRQARDFYAGRRDPTTGQSSPVRNVVIHTAEIGESLAGAESLAAACAQGRPPKADGTKNSASWHYAVDADSVTQSVREEHTAWHAPGLSHCSIGIEHAGRARQSAAEWTDDFSLRMLELSAWLVAGIVARHSVPIVWIDALALQRKQPGICGHDAVSKAFKRSSHWDPGPNFPVAHYLERVHFYVVKSLSATLPPDAPIAPALEPSSMPELERGATGVHVALLQTRLNLHGAALKVDGDKPGGSFGPKTGTALVAFKRAHLLEPTEVVDARTWHALLEDP